jgi:putative aldouronate transport system permease protein
MFPLQLILREIILQAVQMAHGDGDIMRQGVRFATMIVATVPIMCLYPFIQKYFTKGVMVGSVKG